ncbi:MAG: hypothetical protein MJ252_02800 [archaeon]|nr:hypothetical protein [archaeon]
MKMLPTVLFLFSIVFIASKTTHFNLKEGRTNFLEKILEHHNLKTETKASNDMCERRINPLEPNYYYFLPMIKAKLYKEGDSFEFKAGCFKKNTATLKEIKGNSMTIIINADEPESLLCHDLYIMHTTNINQLYSVFNRGDHEIIIENLSQDDLDEIRVNSIKVMGFCQGIAASLRSLVMSLLLYVGGMGNDPENPIPILRPKVPDYMIEHNIALLKFYNNYTPRPREDKVIELDEKYIHTGDFIAISRLDGVDPMIMIGTGSQIGHSTVAAWIDGKLYVIESQDGWYWPYHGIQRNEWKEWCRLARIADFNVAVLPLSEEARAKFDEKKAVEWFKNGIEGLNYGYHNFLFTFIDTPDQNLPFVLTHEHFEFLFTILEKFSEPLATKMLGEGVNMRLGTKNLTLVQAAAEAARRNITFEELLAMPEQDGWEYSDGKNYVCACFCAAFYKAGGMFGDYEIQATEFTPKDVYQLDIFDKNYKKPQECIDADPDLPYCQIMGKFKIDLPGYSTIKPYPHMNERCPSVAPDFYRPDGC